MIYKLKIPKRPNRPKRTKGMDPKNSISVKDVKYLKNTSKYLKDWQNTDSKDPKVAEDLTDLKD